MSFSFLAAHSHGRHLGCSEVWSRWVGQNVEGFSSLHRRRWECSTGGAGYSCTWWPFERRRWQNTQTDRDRHTDRHRQTQRDTDRHRQTQTDTDRHRQTQADTGRHGQTQTDTDRHRQTQADRQRQIARQRQRQEVTLSHPSYNRWSGIWCLWAAWAIGLNSPMNICRLAQIW